MTIGLAVLLPGCDALDIGKSKMPDTLDIYETELRMVSGNYTVPVVEATKAKCFVQDAGNGNIEEITTPFLNVHFDPESYINGSDGTHGNRSKRFRSKIFTRNIEDAETLMFWEHKTHMVGLYSMGSKAFLTRLNICLVDKSSGESIRQTFMVSPPKSITVSGGSGDYVTVNEAYDLANSWLNWKFKNSSEPKTKDRMSVGRWEPCPDYETQYDNWLQIHGREGIKDFKWSCRD